MPRRCAEGLQQGWQPDPHSPSVVNYINQGLDNPEYGDITDTETGTDLVLHYGKPAGASFPQTKLTPRRRSSLLCDEAVGGDDRCAELLESIPEFDTLFERKTPAEVGTLLDAYLLGEESTSEETTTPPPSTDTVSSVDAAFNELMGA